MSETYQNGTLNFYEVWDQFFVKWLVTVLAKN